MTIKTLFFDIETSPNIGLFWAPGKQYVSVESIIQERKIICVCAKWAGSKEIMSFGWDRYKDDKKLLIAISKLINQADEIVAQNGDRFDIKWINGRLLYHNLPPLSAVTSTDTLKLLRKTFYLNSNKLDYVGKFLGVGNKIKTDFGLWRTALLESGTKATKAVSFMVNYCKQDVLLLERVYNKIIKYSPNINKGKLLTGESSSCPNCATSNCTKDGTRITKGGLRKQRYQCHSCGTKFTGGRV